VRANERIEVKLLSMDFPAQRSRGADRFDDHGPASASRSVARPAKNYRSLSRKPWRRGLTELFGGRVGAFAGSSVVAIAKA
jgi:hypothetical protein